MYSKEFYHQCLHPNERDADWWNEDRTYQSFVEAHDIAKEFNPYIIAEIGVRYGYSAYAFLSACPKAFYHGFDLTTGNRASGGVRGTDGFPYVFETVKKNFPEATINLCHMNSQNVLSFLGLPTVDLFHVDGNHTVYGCFHDLVVALYAVRKGGVVLVDDQTNPQVRKGTEMFCDIFHYNIESAEWRDTVKGDCIIVRGDHEYVGHTPWVEQ